MALTYKDFLKKEIDLAPLGWEICREHIPYFCTPRGAKILGWAGVDGIHYCTVRGFGPMIFAVSPMNVGDYVHPIARSFEDVLRLLLSCVDMAALEQCYAWDEAQYNAFLTDCPAAPKQQAALDAIKEKTGLAPMENAFGYVKQLQAELDLTAIPYTEDYYDEDMNPAAPQEAPRWEVYFDGNFWGHKAGQHPGTEIPLGTQFTWADRHWVIPAIYACSKGLVVDLGMRIEPQSMEAFMKKWDLSAENEAHRQFSEEDQMRMELDNPMELDFDATLFLNGKELRSSHGCGCMWNPCLPAQYTADCEGKWAAKHYGLDLNFGWMIRRCCYPWATKRKPELKSLSMAISQEKASIPGPHFRVEKPGDTFTFTYPENGTEYTLTVQEYEAQNMDLSRLPQQDMEYPNHCCAMTYTLTPEMPEGQLSLADCNDGDKPRRKHQPQNGPTAVHDAAVIGIIGGADGPTAILYGHSSKQGKLRAVCSGLYFEPVTDVEWRMVFHEKQYEDMVVALPL